MKLSYFGYSVEQTETAQQYLFDLRPFMTAYGKTAVAFKSGFTHADEHLFLLPYRGDLYQFIITRENEIIKKIQSTDLTVSEISTLLEKDEKIGFTSYVYFGESFLGFASTLRAASAKVFGDFMNELFKKINMRKYRFILHPLMHHVTKMTAMKIPFIGKSSIVVTKYNNIFSEFVRVFNFSTDDLADIDSFEVTIRPKRQKNISAPIKKIINQVDDDGLEKFILRAKEELDGNILDLYLVGHGHISDSLSKKDEETIVQQIYDKIKHNTLLWSKIEEWKEHGTRKEEEPENFRLFRDAAAWPGGMGSV